MPRSSTNPQPIPSIPSQTIEEEFNDYSKGMNTFISNDTLNDKFLRLVKNGRMPTLGEYETRKGFDYYSEAVGTSVEDSETSVTGTADQTISRTAWKATSFTATAGERLSYISLRLKNDASAQGNIVVALYSDDTGLPDTLISKTTIDGSDLTSSYAYHNARFADAPLLEATTYHVVAYIQTGGTGSYSWSSTTDNLLSDGSTSSDSGVTWSTAAYALNHYVYTCTDKSVKGLQRVYKSDGTPATLMTVNDTLYKVSEADGTLTTIKSGLNVNSEALRGLVVNDIFYYVNGKDGLRKWDFTTESQVNSSNYTLIAEHKGLLFLVDANDPNKLVFSNFADYETFTSTDFIYVPSPKTGDPIVAIYPLNGTLVIQTRFNKYILYGTDNATFQLEQATGRKGTYNQETVTFDKNFAYFISDDGVYSFDGTSDKLISINNYEDIRSLTLKEKSCIIANKGRLYVWFRVAGQNANSQCHVYNLNFDSYESLDTEAYVGRAAIDSKNDSDLIVGSSLTGQVYWQERNNNNYDNVGQGYEFRLETHNMHFGTPSREKEIRFWKPRLGAQTGDYTISCAYATDLRDRFTVQSAVNTQGTGTEYGAGVNWGAFTWGTTKESQSDLQVPGGFRRIALAYYHSEARQPHLFLGHTFIVEVRDIR